MLELLICKKCKSTVRITNAGLRESHPHDVTITKSPNYRTSNLMAFKDHLILITSPEDFADEHILIERCLNRDCLRLHVRKPGRSKRI